MAINFGLLPNRSDGVPNAYTHIDYNSIIQALTETVAAYPMANIPTPASLGLFPNKAPKQFMNSAEFNGIVTILGGVVTAANGGDTGTPTAVTLSSVEPNSGKAGDTLILTGTGFTGALNVLFAGVAVGSGKFSVLSATQMTVIVPAVSAGSNPIQVVGANATSSARAFVVQATAANAIPVASASGPASIMLPASQVTLAGMGTDSDGSIKAYAWRQVSGPVTATNLPATTKDVTISGLHSVGTYRFGFKTQDNLDAWSEEIFVNVTVNAGAITGKTLLLVIGDSVANGDFASPGVVQATLNRLGNPPNVTLRQRTFSGKTEEWYRGNKMAEDLTFVDDNSGSYDQIIVINEFLLNDATPQYATFEAKGVANVFASIKATAAAFKTNRPKLIYIKAGGLNRVDLETNGGYSQPEFDQVCTQINDLIRTTHKQWADDFIDVTRQPAVGGSSAPNNRLLNHDGIHPLTPGAAILAEEWAYVLAPYLGVSLNPPYRPFMGVVASANGSVSDSIPRDGGLLSYKKKIVQNGYYNSEKLEAGKDNNGVQYAWDCIFQELVTFGPGRVHGHLPSAGRGSNPSDPQQGRMVIYLDRPLDTSANVANPWKAPGFLVGQYWNAQESGLVLPGESGPSVAYAWPTDDSPNLDLEFKPNADGTNNVTHFVGDRPKRTVVVPAYTKMYVYTLHTTNNGSIITNLTFSADSATAVAGAAYTPKAYTEETDDSRRHSSGPRVEEVNEAYSGGACIRLTGSDNGSTWVEFYWTGKVFQYIVVMHSNGCDFSVTQDGKQYGTGSNLSANYVPRGVVFEVNDPVDGPHVTRFTKTNGVSLCSDGAATPGGYSRLP